MTKEAREPTEQEVRVALAICAVKCGPVPEGTSESDKRDAAEDHLPEARAAISAMPSGWRPIVCEIEAERRRHVEVEGWTEAHDDEHGNGELARAAAAYAYQSSASTYDDDRSRFDIARIARKLWPWGASWWKPKTARRDLIRAGALIVAEIERLDRLPSPPESTP